MSVMVVGLSHKSSPMPVLERAALSGDAVTKLLCDLRHAGPVAAAFVISTCNRVEVYADVDRFHPAVTAISELLARHCGLAEEELTRYLYVHHEDRAVSHLLTVACGLDSIVTGEEQVVGQVRSALKLAREQGTLGGALGDLGRLALRAGKRARAQTAIGRAGASLLTLALDLAGASLGRGLAGCDVLVAGAGSMSALAVATAGRAGAASVVVANRTTKHAERVLSTARTVATRVAGLADLPAELSGADVAICCTGAAGYVITADMVPAARRARLVLIDLAMPRDVEPAVAALAGVTVIGLDQLSRHATAASPGDVAAVRAIMAAELAAYRARADAAGAVPTVLALRGMAAEVVDAELARLAGRLNAVGASARVLDETALTVRRVVDKLLHAPTVRIKELAAAPDGQDYAAALRVLFDLDPRAVRAVTHDAADGPGGRQDPS